MRIIVRDNKVGILKAVVDTWDIVGIIDGVDDVDTLDIKVN